MDLTTLSGDDTDERVRRLCAKARQPIQQDLVQKLGITRTWHHQGRRRLRLPHLHRDRAACPGGERGIPVAARSPPAFLLDCLRSPERVAGDSPLGGSWSARDRHSVITRSHVFGGRWQALYDEVATFKQACGRAHMKANPGNRRPVDIPQRGSCKKFCRDDGGRRLHQDLDW